MPPFEEVQTQLRVSLHRDPDDVGEYMKLIRNASRYALQK